ncbi:hypothetical protein RvY_15464-2 [Ramazzottius varieornatus]|uniref:Uncharacterized protein n=1 Tax=Ramazzottius varieornatus TaxID=947166 RepID=A0A1D1VW89_RAMVA|nr:hypothetical protein RvY_15464-2 [Ramazzottius varieornatus]
MMEESETLESPPTIRTTTESKKPITISLVDKPPDRTGVFTTDPLPSTSRGAGTHTLPHTAHIPVSPPQSLLRSDPKRREKLYKVLVIGDIGVGKTSCVKRYVHRFFSQQYRATVRKPRQQVSLIRKLLSSLTYLKRTRPIGRSGLTLPSKSSTGTRTR